MALKFTKATKSKAKLRMALIGPSGGGKAQPVDRLVLTPTKWVPIGNLSVGDKVVDPDGGVGIVDGIFPQGFKEAFGVHFRDGSYTECCSEHLWLTQTVYERADKKPGNVRAFSQIMDSVYSGVTQENRPRPNHYIPMVSKIDLGDSDQVLPIDPWLLGVIIGDGCLVGGSVTISKPGSEIREAVAECLPDGLRVSKDYNDTTFGIVRDTDRDSNPMKDALVSLGLFGKKSTEKSIPECYMFSSFENRVALLQGLLDTDGYISGHHIEYSSSSPELASQARDLVRSVGGTCSFTSRIPHYSHNGEYRSGAENWRMNISLPNSILPVRLQPKLGKYIPRTKYQPYRSISEISSVGKKECVCIKVSTKRNLYVTDDYIVTHNTYSALSMATHLAGPNGKVAVIDTERSSASKYADKFSFDSLELETFSPQNYIDAIRAASDGGYDVLVIDSLSHAWMGEGGALEMAAVAEKKTGNKFTSWKEVTPLHNKMFAAIIGAPMHVIATMRAKTEYVLEANERGKMAPKKVGMGAVQKNDSEFEFDVVGEMTQDNDLIVTKTRCSELNGRIFNRPGEDVAKIVGRWLSDGAEPPAVKPAEVVTNENVPQATVDVPADAVMSVWAPQIEKAESVAKLKEIGALLRDLPVDAQKKLAQAYKNKLQSLADQG